MTPISITELQRNAENILRRIGKGKRLVLMHQGHPVGRIEPVTEPVISADDPFYRLAKFSINAEDSLTNEEMDTVIYGR